MVGSYEYSLNIGLGSDLAEELLQKSRGVLKLTDPEWLEIFETYKTKLQELKDKQNF